MPSVPKKSAAIAIGAVLALALAITLILVIRSAAEPSSEPSADSSATRLPAPGQAGDAPSAGAGSVVEENSYYLDEVPDAKVTVTEFLDFECEYCGMLYPAMEEMREKYDGQVSFVVRYFLIQSHTNTLTSALAVEAAGQQGRFEDMYNKMFQNQSQWGESDVDKSDLFRTYAQEIGLDMEAYDAAIADPKSEERVMFDFEGGQALGVTGTPTVFINDTKTEIEDLASLDAAIAAALAE